MSYQLRPYQEQAVTAVLTHFRKERSPACVVLPTGAGKSLVIAELCRLAQGRILVLAHVKELCEQNYRKFMSLSGQRAGLYSAGLGQKLSGEKVTFGSVQSVAPHIHEFSEPISLVIIDECHRVSLNPDSQYVQIISALRQRNERLLVLGLTATPYRLGMGFCYQNHAWGMVRSSEEKPFVRCVFEMTLKQMVERGYLTPPTLVDAPIAQYDFSSLPSVSAQNWRGPNGSELKYDQEPDPDAVNTLLVRSKRVTQAIVEQVIALTLEQGRSGTMIFASTVEHAQEIFGYLPSAQAGLVLGSTSDLARDETIHKFTQQKLKYLVNVAVLTTGFDAPHVDFIAILRRTQSVSLYQQIVGRGLRLAPGKTDCLVIDYAGNGFDLYAPEIGEAKPNAASEMVKVSCPLCGFDNDFWGLKDSEGHIVEHYGRRCTAFDSNSNQRCDYRFRFKECPACNGENDIAARRCSHCEKILIDPDDLLKDALRLKDALVLRVSGVQYLISHTKLTLVYHDEDGAQVKEHFDFDKAPQRALFNRIYARRLASGRRPLELQTAAQALQLQAYLPRPDFVVARAQKQRGRPVWYKIQERIFDYQGPHRIAARAD